MLDVGIGGHLLEFIYFNALGLLQISLIMLSVLIKTYLCESIA
jgi:hypothetical protein